MMNNNNPVAGMSFADYSQLSEVDRKRLWNAGRVRAAAIEQAERDAQPEPEANEKLLAQIEAQQAALRKRGADTSLYDREADSIRGDMAATAEREARMATPAAQLTQQTFAEYRDYLKTNGSVDDVVAFEAATDAYWSNGGDGDSTQPAWANAIKSYVSTRVRIENEATAAANEAQAQADMAQRQADLKQHDANAMKQTETPDDESESA